jgi:hypothetical protein
MLECSDKGARGVRELLYVQAFQGRQASFGGISPTGATGFGQ